MCLHPTVALRIGMDFSRVLLSWGFRGSQHIISQFTMSHNQRNHIASHLMSSQPTTNSITTAKRPILLHHFTSDRITSCHIASHHTSHHITDPITSQGMTPHHITPHDMTSHDATRHFATNHIASPHVTSQPTTLIHPTPQPTT